MTMTPDGLGAGIRQYGYAGGSATGGYHPYAGPATSPAGDGTISTLASALPTEYVAGATELAEDVPATFQAAVNSVGTVTSGGGWSALQTQLGARGIDYSAPIDLKQLVRDGKLPGSVLDGSATPGDHAGNRDREMAEIQLRITQLKLQLALAPEADRPGILAQIDRLKERYVHAKVLDFLVNFAISIDAPQEVIDAIDKMKVRVAEIDSDAAVDVHSETIYLHPDVMEQMKGVVDQVAEPDNAMPSEMADEHFVEVLGVVALFTHEVGHVQHAHEGDDTADRRMERAFAARVEDLKAAAASGSDAALRAVAVPLLEQYIALFEIEQYVAQEQLMYNALREQGLPTDRDWLTIGDDGQPLQRDQAVANVMALIDAQAPDYPLTFARDLMSVEGWDQIGADGLPGWKSPGWKSPGWKSPGFMMGQNQLRHPVLAELPQFKDAWMNAFMVKA